MKTALIIIAVLVFCLLYAQIAYGDIACAFQKCVVVK